MRTNSSLLEFATLGAASLVWLVLVFLGSPSPAVTWVLFGLMVVLFVAATVIAIVHRRVELAIVAGSAAVLSIPAAILASYALNALMGGQP